MGHWLVALRSYEPSKAKYPSHRFVDGPILCHRATIIVWRHGELLRAGLSYEFHPVYYQLDWYQSVHLRGVNLTLILRLGSVQFCFMYLLGLTVAGL